MQQLRAVLACLLVVCSNAFTFSALQTPSTKWIQHGSAVSRITVSRTMSQEPSEGSEPTGVVADEEEDGEPVDEATRIMLAKMKKVKELKSQEVFIKRSTGKHQCTTCDWEYDEVKGDAFMIGGLVQPGTAFAELPSNWRCPTCRTSKDNFKEITEEIPGFEVNQGYGFGGNSMTGGEKSGLIFGGLFVFFVLFIGGYGLS